METLIAAALLLNANIHAPCGAVDNAGRVNRPVTYALQDKNTGALQYCAERAGCFNHAVGSCVLKRDPANDYDAMLSFKVTRR